MYGSRLATAAARPPPPTPAIANRTTGNNRTRDPVTSPPLPVPDRIARGQPSPKGWPQLFWTATSLADGLAALPRSDGRSFAIQGAKKQRDQGEHRRHSKAPNTDARVEKGGACAANGKNGDVAGHPQQARSRVSRLLSPGPPHHVGKIDHDLCRGAGHQRRRRRASEVNAMDRILNRHRRHERHPGDDRLPRIAIFERAA